jgi:hypothetical protein
MTRPASVAEVAERDGHAEGEDHRWRSDVTLRVDSDDPHADKHGEYDHEPGVG